MTSINHLSRQNHTVLKMEQMTILLKWGMQFMFGWCQLWAERNVGTSHQSPQLRARCDTNKQSLNVRETHRQTEKEQTWAHEGRARLQVCAHLTSTPYGHTGTSDLHCWFVLFWEDQNHIRQTWPELLLCWVTHTGAPGEENKHLQSFIWWHVMMWHFTQAALTFNMLR